MHRLKASQEESENKVEKKGLLNFVVGSGQKNNSQEVEYLHKLVNVFWFSSFLFIKVNSLTETITEKDFILENTKQVNKELGKRVQELEKILDKKHSKKLLISDDCFMEC